MFVAKNWKNEVKRIAIDLDKCIKKQDFENAKELITKLVKMKKDGNPEIKRDACIAVDFIIKRYGTIDPNNFLLPDWKGDFRGIKKKITTARRSNNLIELQQIIKRLNTVVLTNDDDNVREDAVEMLIFVGTTDSKLIDRYEQNYIDAIMKESERSVKKDLNTLLRIIDRSYPEDYENTIKKLSKTEKTIKIVPKYDFDNDFVRYKVQVINNTDKILWDVRFLITKYDKNYVLRDISPDSYEIFEDYMVIFSVIQPGDMKEFIARIEPKSSQLYLEGKLYYKNPEDHDFSILAAEDLVVDLLDCWPELDKQAEKVSIVHCRELFDFHVKYKSMNSFALPVSITPEVAYNVGKRILSDLNFTLVMDIVNQDRFYGEALYYGRTSRDPKGQDEVEEFVIVLRASHENYAIEINVGCNINSVLVAIQIKFDNMLRQILTSREEFTEKDRIIELRCPNCFQVYDKISRDWCPWCGKDIDKNLLL